MLTILFVKSKSLLLPLRIRSRKKFVPQATRVIPETLFPEVRAQKWEAMNELKIPILDTKILISKTYINLVILGTPTAHTNRGDSDIQNCQLFIIDHTELCDQKYWTEFAWISSPKWGPKLCNGHSFLCGAN